MRARVARGLSQTAVAAELEMPRAQTLGEWELGRSNFSISDLAALCRLYGVSSDYILGLSELPKVRGSGGIINLAVERAILGATSGRQLERDTKALAAMKPAGILFGYAVPREFELLDDEEFSIRSRALATKLRRLANDPGTA